MTNFNGDIYWYSWVSTKVQRNSMNEDEEKLFTY